MKRIQQKRTKGWKAPPNSASCTRGLGRKYGNPFPAGRVVPWNLELRDRVADWCDRNDWRCLDHFNYFVLRDPVPNAQEAVRLFERYVLPLWIEDGRLEALRDKDYLMCFCKEGKPCHVDSIIRYLTTP